MFLSVRSALAGLAVLCAVPAQAALINSYDFTSGYSDTLGNGNDLQSFGGAVANGVYSFGPGQGLKLTNALANTASYGIEFGLTVSDFGGGAFDKLVDFQNRATDQGFYLDGQKLRFYSYAATSGQVDAGQSVVIGLERKNDQFRFFLNNQEIASGIVDANDWGISSANILHFFMDDTRQGTETFAGSSDFIRIHDDASTFGQGPLVNQPAPVPLPAALPLLVAGLGALGLVRARRRA